MMAKVELQLHEGKDKKKNPAFRQGFSQTEHL